MRKRVRGVVRAAGGGAATGLAAAALAVGLAGVLLWALAGYGYAEARSLCERGTFLPRRPPASGDGVARG